MNGETLFTSPKIFRFFHGRVIGHEIYARSARLTKICHKLRLRGLAVDKVTERRCGIDIKVLDLTVPSLRLLLDVIEAEKHRILMMFFAPPMDWTTEELDKLKTELANQLWFHD